MSEQTLLAIFAHPDDESFGSGGALAYHATQGARVVLVCATRGEQGQIADEALATPRTLAAVREAELRRSAEALGVSRVVLLDYRDSGMAGTAANAHPNAFINARADEVVGKLTAVIRQERPQAVLTFEPNGGYGHPDHIAIHHHTAAAVLAAAAPTYRPEQERPWQVSRLFQTSIPRSFFRRLRQKLEEMGEDTTDFDQFETEATGWPDDAIDLWLDVSPVIDAKWQSIQAHQTQQLPSMFFTRLPPEQMKELMSREGFGLAWPAGAADGARPLRHFFDGLQS